MAEQLILKGTLEGHVSFLVGNCTLFVHRAAAAAAVARQRASWSWS